MTPAKKPTLPSEAEIAELERLRANFKAAESEYHARINELPARVLLLYAVTEAEESLLASVVEHAPSLLHAAKLAREAAEFFWEFGAHLDQALVTQAFADGTGQPDSETRRALTALLARYKEGTETFLAIYVVSDRYGAAVVQRHTMLSEAAATYKWQKELLRDSATHRAELRRETWKGNDMIAWEKIDG